jgi:predicted nucleic acid-binding protein
MILFCDTSALIKFYLVEEQSDALRTLAAEADAVAVGRIAWAEAHAAFARRAREAPSDRDAMEAAKRALAADWRHYAIVEITHALMLRAGDYADAFALRAYDAVQLASAQEIALATEDSLTFACFDARLNKAARILGMTTPFLDFV